MDEIPSTESPAPGVKTSVYCSNCEVDVEPAGKGVCPVCKRFLPENIAALTHGGRRMSLPPERASRRAELRKEVWADLGGIVPPIIAEVGEDFVSACVLRDQLVEHLEAIGPLTTRGTRRAAMDLYLATSARIERLSAMLGAFRSEVKGAGPGPGVSARLSHLDVMPVSALHDVQAFYERQSKGEVLSADELAVLAYLQRAMRGTVLLPPDPHTPGDTLKRTDLAPIDAMTKSQPEESKASIDALVSQPEAAVCSYGCGPRCTELKETRPDVWHAFHYSDPVEVEKREAAANKVLNKEFRLMNGLDPWPRI